MGPKLMQKCSQNCKEQCEFSLFITILKLILTDNEKNRGFEDIALTLTIDSNIIKIDNIQSSDENVNIQREVNFQTTPNHFSQKLRKSPIMMNLARECMDLGTVKLQITDCFADAVLCDDFTSERIICDYKFKKDEVENASMEISLQTVRKSIDNDGIKDFLRANAKRRERMRNKAHTVIPKVDSSVGSDDTISSFMCDADLLKELCPLEDKTFHSFSSKSKHSKASKCLSDIAASLDINKCSNVQKTFCRGCRGLSISGITCDNKMRVSKKDSRDLKNSKNSEIFIRPLNRICSECFANLSILPQDAPCPKCSCIKKPQNEDKAPKLKATNADISSNCIKKIFRDILSGEKRTCKKGLQTDSELKCKSRKKQKRKGHGKSSMLPRCSKVKRANKVSNDCKKSLRIKHYGVVLGHESCQSDALLVPKNMGWLWNAKIPGITNIRRGWRPGAVPKSVARMMKRFLKKESQPPAEGSLIENNNKCYTPSVQVEKKLAKYKITLNPVCNKSFGEDVSPIVFNISKYDDMTLRLDAKKMLKSRGITKTCKCRNICECSCIDDFSRKRFLYELETICQVMKINPPMKYEDLKDISECSEIDFEFTPPFKMMNKCKRDVRMSVATTQYEEPSFEKFEETEESSEHDTVVKMRKVKKNVKAKLGKDKKKIQKSLGSSRSKPSEILRDIKPKHCCVSYCRPNLDAFQCDQSTTNYNPLYLRCLPNYPICPPRQTNCQSNSCYNNKNC
ncbi:hypothetical protein ACKWTF_012402 [Chironomus riparius]